MTHAASVMAIGTAVEVAGSVVGVFRRIPAIDSDVGNESD